MPIVSHVLEQTVQENGSTHNVVRLYDQDAEEYSSSFSAPEGFDIQTKIDNLILEMNLQLQITEFEALINSVQPE